MRAMARDFTHAIDGSGKVRLQKYDPRDTTGLDKSQGLAQLEKLGVELAELTNLLSYAGQHALLVVVQGRDASGKDGVIRKVLEYANVLNAHVVPFKAPTPEELAHDFLWRVHAQAPALGRLALFNRSHYEDVIAVRVHQLAPPEVWKSRYEQINGFERLLVESRTIVLKFYLHVSPEEQYERLLEREEDPRTAWKLNVGDWRELPLWKQTTAAYEDALERCSSKQLPWYLVPADRKWFRNLAVFQRLVMALRPYKQQWLDILKARRKEALKEIEALRQQSARQLKLPGRKAKPSR
jgi:PPK2 family polyphosphate:nucleotide phosphotransferase